MTYLELHFLNLIIRGPKPLNAPRVGGVGSRIIVGYLMRTR